MKKYIMLLVILLIGAQSAFANLKWCLDKHGIHCVDYIGSQNRHAGKYVKVTRNSYPSIHCTRGGLKDFMPQQAFNKSEKDRIQNQTFEQCIDADCKKSISLGTDKYTIVKNNNEFISDPRVFQVRLNQNYGKSCTTWS